MSQIDLIILGMFMEKPQSAYDIEKDIAAHHYTRWSRISIPSVYKKVSSLDEKGFIRHIAQAQGGRKKVYEITAQGRQYFGELMLQSAERPPVMLLDANVMLSNLSKVSKEEGARLIAQVKSGLEKQIESCKAWAEQYKEMPLTGRAIIKQQEMVAQMLLCWLAGFADDWMREEGK